MNKQESKNQTSRMDYKALSDITRHNKKGISKILSSIPFKGKVLCT